MEYSYKLEIALNEQKVKEDGQYELSEIYAMIRTWFAEERIPEIPADSGLAFASDDETTISGMFLNISELYHAEWFRNYVTKMHWFNHSMGDGYEDVLKTFAEEGI